MYREPAVEPQAENGAASLESQGRKSTCSEVSRALNLTSAVKRLSDRQEQSGQANGLKLVSVLCQHQEKVLRNLVLFDPPESSNTSRRSVIERDFSVIKETPPRFASSTPLDGSVDKSPDISKIEEVETSESELDEEVFFTEAKHAEGDVSSPPVIDETPLATVVDESPELNFTDESAKSGASNIVSEMEDLVNKIRTGSRDVDVHKGLMDATRITVNTREERINKHIDKVTELATTLLFDVATLINDFKNEINPDQREYWTEFYRTSQESFQNYVESLEKNFRDLHSNKSPNSGPSSNSSPSPEEVATRQTEKKESAILIAREKCRQVEEDVNPLIRLWNSKDTSEWSEVDS